jgi:hypothetical protein
MSGNMYFKFVKKCQEISAGKSVPPASKKVGRGKFPSHLPRWDRFLAEPLAGGRFQPGSIMMGLEVRGAMMNAPQQKDIPNV